MNDSCKRFWDQLETMTGCAVPIYLKNILFLMGYDNPLSVKGISSKDIENIQAYMKSKEYEERIPPNSNKTDFYGVSTIREKAYILPGHVKLLEELVCITKLSLLSFINKPRTQGTAF